VDVLGIDVGKRDLHATLLQNDRAASKSVPNSETGIAQLQTWLKNRNANRVHACLEATGGWSEQVAIALGKAGHVVSIVNPARIRAFAQSEMVRTKQTGSMQLSSPVFADFINQSRGRLLRRNTHSTRPCSSPTQPYPDAS